MKTKNILQFFIAVLIAQNVSWAQDEDRAVRDPWNGPILIENQTVVQPYKSSLQLEVYHRMGTVDNGISDLYGIYGASNILLGLNYGITDNLMVGFATEKENKLQRFHWKYKIFDQTESGAKPVGLSYYGNFVIDGSDKDNFGPEETFRSIHRFSYFTQLILSRKFTDQISFQLAPSFAYFNSIETAHQNMNSSIMAGLRYKPFFSFGFMAEYEYPLYVKDNDAVKPNFAIGIEKSTATHNFQLFVTSFKNLVNQHNFVYNESGFFDEEGLLIGFNITATLR